MHCLILQISMSAMCMALAARRASTLRALTHAAVWRVTFRSQTTGPAKPKMVRTQAQKGETEA